jgi:hypothetical protein
MTFREALWNLMMGNPDKVSPPVFVVGCALMGLIVVMLDWISFSLRGHSFCDLTYGKATGKTIFLLCLWSAGAGIGGYLGSAVNIVQLTRAGCIGVGVGWPVILPRLVESFSKSKEDDQNPEGS